jgi:hypothetical protein
LHNNLELQSVVMADLIEELVNSCHIHIVLPIKVQLKYPMFKVLSYLSIYAVRGLFWFILFTIVSLLPQILLDI